MQRSVGVAPPGHRSSPETAPPDGRHDQRRNRKGTINERAADPPSPLVFYNTSYNGHVVISLGNGTVISTSAGGRIGIVGISYFQRPLGWAYAPW